MENRASGETRVIRSWAGIYDLVNSMVFLLFGGTGKLHSDIIAMAGIREGDRVLDIGCGTGLVLRDVAGRYSSVRGVGIDASDEMISVARKKASTDGLEGVLDYRVAQAEKLPFEDGSFDAVLNVFLLHHLPMGSKLKCLQEANRVLKRGKVLVLVDVDEPSNILGRLIGFSRMNVKEIRENMEQPLADLLRKSGFSAPELVRKDHGIFSFIRCLKA